MLSDIMLPEYFQEQKKAYIFYMFRMKNFTYSSDYRNALL